MGFNGEILVGRGESFISALRQFWNWDEEVLATRPMRDGWQVIHVRSPAEPDALSELAEAAGGPVLACLVFEGTTGHVRGIGTTGSWEAWLNPANVAHVKAWNAVDEQIGGNLYPDGTEQDHARVQELEDRLGAAINAELPAALHSATAWALGNALYADPERVEEAFATPWGSSVEHGFLALLSALGISSA